MSTLTLRPYQQNWIAELRAAYAAGHRYVLGVAPTGFGKTVCFAHVVAGARARGGRVLILAHRVELVDQISDTLRAFDVPHSFIAAGYPYQLGAQVYVASIQTVARRAEIVAPPSLIVIDEAHHCTATNTLGRFLARFPNSSRLGVTATPQRLSGEGMRETFSALVRGPDYQELIDGGALAPARVFAPSSVDLRGVHRRAGDFVASELEARVNTPTLTGDAISHYRRHADGLPAVAFCVSVKHAHDVAAQFNSAGYPAAVLDGSLDRTTRRAIVRAFRTGALRVLTSCDLISEGFDVPGIVCGVLLRPTASLGLYLQQVGRCLRTAPGKREAVILDHAGNTLRHGLPTDRRDWTLDGAPERAGRSNAQSVPSVRVCESCFAANASSALTCGQCGAPFPVRARTVEQVDGELQEITAIPRQSSARTLQELIQIGRLRKMRNPYAWAHHVLRGRERKRREMTSGAQTLFD